MTPLTGTCAITLQRYDKSLDIPAISLINPLSFLPIYADNMQIAKCSCQLGKADERGDGGVNAPGCTCKSPAHPECLPVCHHSHHTCRAVLFRHILA